MQLKTIDMFNFKNPHPNPLPSIKSMLGRGDILEEVYLT